MATTDTIEANQVEQLTAREVLDRLAAAPRTEAEAFAEPRNLESQAAKLRGDGRRVFEKIHTEQAEKLEEKARTLRASINWQPGAHRDAVLELARAHLDRLVRRRDELEARCAELMRYHANNALDPKGFDELTALQHEVHPYRVAVRELGHALESARNEQPAEFTSSLAETSNALGVLGRLLMIALPAAIRDSATELKKALQARQVELQEAIVWGTYAELRSLGAGGRRKRTR